MNQNDYKAVVGKYPTGVTVISTKYHETIFGFTSNSFTSVSLEPPIVSFCLNKKSGSLAAFKASEHFAVSILAFDQGDIANHFASSSIDKFGMVQNYQAISGCPIVDGAVSYVDCKKLNMFEVGDHVIFTGEALEVKICNDKKPLLYFARSYNSLTY